MALDSGYWETERDLVEVVRCRNCKHYHWEQESCHGKTEHVCSVLNAQVFADFYCYHGTPKMDRKGEKSLLYADLDEIIDAIDGKGEGE